MKVLAIERKLTELDHVRPTRLVHCDERNRLLEDLRSGMRHRITPCFPGATVRGSAPWAGLWAARIRSVLSQLESRGEFAG